MSGYQNAPSSYELYNQLFPGLVARRYETHGKDTLVFKDSACANRFIDFLDQHRYPLIEEQKITVSAQLDDAPQEPSCDHQQVSLNFGTHTPGVDPQAHFFDYLDRRLGARKLTETGTTIRYRNAEDSLALYQSLFPGILRRESSDRDGVERFVCTQDGAEELQLFAQRHGAEIYRQTKGFLRVGLTEAPDGDGVAGMREVTLTLTAPGAGASHQLQLRQYLDGVLDRIHPRDETSSCNADEKMIESLPMSEQGQQALHDARDALGARVARGEPGPSDLVRHGERIQRSRQSLLRRDPDGNPDGAAPERNRPSGPGYFLN